MNVDVRKTIRYYDSIRKGSLCDCNYCKSYYLQIKAEYPQVNAYLRSLGIDIEKPFEISPLEPDSNGILEYSACQYIVFGTCPETYHQKFGDVEFRLAASYPCTGIVDEHFVLELYPIRLKFMEFP